MDTGKKIIYGSIITLFVVGIALFLANSLMEKPTETVEVPATGRCAVTADADTVIYSRPSLDAHVFGTLALGETQNLSGRTLDGWYAFTPAVAQAGNAGPFRNRFILPSASAHLSGDCSGLPLVTIPTGTACYTMAFEDTPVYAASSDAAQQVGTITKDGYAKVMGMKKGTKPFYQVLLETTNTLGWIDSNAVNFNGDCDSISEL